MRALRFGRRPDSSQTEGPALLCPPYEGGPQGVSGILHTPCRKGRGEAFLKLRFPCQGGTELWSSARAERAPCALRPTNATFGRSGPLFTVKPVKLTRNSVLTALVILMILWALPGAIQDTLQTGRVYVFSRQFFEDLPRRFSGPGRLRFILQPLVAILLGVRCGLADAKSGQSPFIFALLFHAHKRKELLRSGITAVGHVLAFGILLDAVAQWIIYGQIHPGAALVIGPLLVWIPYASARGLTLRLARRLQPPRSVSS